MTNGTTRAPTHNGEKRATVPRRGKGTFSPGTIRRDFIKNRMLYAMTIPMLLFYLLFFYQPMYGATIAFKDYVPKLGIAASEWVGLKHFRAFFTDVYAGRIISNTLILSFEQLLFGFPAPIILAVMINEVRKKWCKSLVQTATYLPHFISLMVVCGLISEFTNRNGLINDVIAAFGGQRVTMLLKPAMFRPLYVISGIWQEVGWGSIVYLAAMSGVDEELYEAARIDGVGKLRQIWHVTLPGILPTIVVMLLLKLGAVMDVGYEKIILLYNSATYSTADVISTYVYRKGIQEYNWSYASAVGLFNSAINFALILMANALSRRLNETSLW